MNTSQVIDDSFLNSATIDIPITIAMTVVNNTLLATPSGWEVLAGKIVLDAFFVGHAAAYGGLISNSASDYFEKDSLGYYVGNALGGVIKYGIKDNWQLDDVILGAINSFSYSYINKETFGGDTGKVFYIEAMQEAWFLNFMFAMLTPSKSFEINAMKIVATFVPTLIIAGVSKAKDLYNTTYNEYDEIDLNDSIDSSIVELNEFV